jgi:hypothetical protein
MTRADIILDDDLVHTDQPTVCRREGCRDLTFDHLIRLCPSHLLAYEAEAERILQLARQPLSREAP